MAMRAEAEQLKSCCARFYEEPILRALFGDILHPGGLHTTTQLGRCLDLNACDHVLDVACGPGRSAVHLTETFGCRVTGIDYSVQSTAEARQRANGQLQFAVGDAERLPFSAARFDVVVIECSLCLVPQKVVAVEEMGRVLKPGGRVGIADIALEQPLPVGVRDLAAWVACVAGACTTAGYRQLLGDAGFVDIRVEDASWALSDLVQEAGRKLFVFDVATRLGKLPRLPMAPTEIRVWLQEAQRWIADGSARYLLASGRRPYS